MKKNNYYIYTNINEFYGFLVHNTIYPTANEANSLSLSKKGFVYLTKKRFPRDYIYSKCQVGIMSPIVLEVSIRTSHDKSAIALSDDELLISNPISLNALVKVFYLDGDLPLSLYDDAFFFRSLLSKEEFEYGTDSQPDLNKIDDCIFDEECQKKWDKFQGFFACRYGSLRSEFKAGKNLMIASNLDNETALEILGQNQSDYFASTFAPYRKYFFREDMRVSSQLSLFINENYDCYLTNKKIKDKSEEKGISEQLFQACLKYTKDMNLLDLIKDSAVDEVKEIEITTQGDVFELKSLLFNEGKERVRFLYLLNSIVSKGYDESLDYLSNFDALSSTEKKCLLGMYGLCVGLSRLSISIKRKRADLLLFSFNKTKKYFKDYIDSAVNTNDFFSLREIITDNVTKDGFNYVAYNRDYELNYLKIMCANKLSLLFNLPRGMIGKDIVKFTTAEELHKAYLMARKGNQ